MRMFDGLFLEYYLERRFEIEGCSFIERVTSSWSHRVSGVWCFELYL